MLNLSTFDMLTSYFNVNYGFVSRSWAAANRAIYMPIFIPQPFVIARFWTFNGSTASGHVDVGIYDRAGRRILSTGSVSQAGTSVIQEYAVTATRIGSGAYFLALAADSTSTTFIGGGNGGLFRQMGAQQQSTAFVLPATATFAAPTGVDIPIFGIGSGAFL